MKKKVILPSFSYIQCQVSSSLTKVEIYLAYTITSPVCTVQTNRGSTRLCLHGPIPKHVLTQTWGEPGLIFHTQASWLHSQVKLLYSVIKSIVLEHSHGHKTPECSCAKSKLARVLPRFVFTRHFSKLTRVRPVSNPPLEVG